ncbi:hypothetical protein ABZ816_02130 [Actinosynnema sp. NPDC047251]|uniref:hypothetical protein n=1 Tax=Saccharothrix espanaensis TaxID=103731 RepID=UPI00031C7ADD|nr:hypothetical protein [Saccharothrix espanaensis]
MNPHGTRTLSDEAATRHVVSLGEVEERVPEMVQFVVLGAARRPQSRVVVAARACPGRWV